MTFKGIFLFYFTIIFNVFSDSDDKIMFNVIVQDVVNDKDLKEVVSKEISIDKNKLNKDKYKSEELIKLLGINEDLELKNHISNKNFLIEIEGRIFFKNEEIADIYLKDKKFKSREIKFRDKRKYDFKLYNRCKVKDKFTVNNENGSKDYSKQDFIKTCLLIDKRLNNENCCFLECRDVYFITLSYDILKVEFDTCPYDIRNNYIYFDENINNICDSINIVIISKDNKTMTRTILSAKTLYDIVKRFTNGVKLTDGCNVRYAHIEEVKYNENKSFNFTNKLKDNSVDKINEELKKIDVDVYKDLTIILNIDGREEGENGNYYKEDKNLTYCERVRF